MERVEPEARFNSCYRHGTVRFRGVQKSDTIRDGYSSVDS